jgi:hypothetical protein
MTWMKVNEIKQIFNEIFKSVQQNLAVFQRIKLIIMTVGTFLFNWMKVNEISQ